MSQQVRSRLNEDIHDRVEQFIDDHPNDISQSKALETLVEDGLRRRGYSPNGIRGDILQQNGMIATVVLAAMAFATYLKTTDPFFMTASFGFLGAGFLMIVGYSAWRHYNE